MSFALSAFPVVFTAVLLALSVFVYEVDPTIPLFFGAVVAGLSAFIGGYSWNIIKEGFVNSISRAISALVILLIIGMIIGVWIASGIVPLLIHFGFTIMHPLWFLPLIFILCCIMSVVTGSSWTTIGTIGVAAVAVGQGLGVPVAVIAGAVVSGAFFGDKLSPLSDSTNLTPSILGVDLYEHIKHMLYSTLPSFAISLIMYAILGLFLAQNGQIGNEAAQYQAYVAENFNLSPLLLLPPIAVIIMIVLKVPAIPSLIVGVIAGGLAQMFVQNHGLGEVFHVLYNGFSIDTGLTEIDQLFSRGGMVSMYSVVVLGIISLAFGGIMHRCGMLDELVGKMPRLVSRQGNLVATTLFTSLAVNMIGANQYLAVIIPGQMFEGAYKKLRLHSKNLTRALEGSGTLVAPLISWNTSGIFVFTALGVSPLEYAPYAFLCWMTLIVVAIYGYTGITMERTRENQKGVVYEGWDV